MERALGPGDGRLFAWLALDDAMDGLRIGRFFEGLPKLSVVKQLGDVRQSMEMLLELPVRNKEQHHEMHRLVVEGLEINPGFGPAKRFD